MSQEIIANWVNQYKNNSHIYSNTEFSTEQKNLALEKMNEYDFLLHHRLESMEQLERMYKGTEEYYETETPFKESKFFEKMVEDHARVGYFYRQYEGEI